MKKVEERKVNFKIDSYDLFEKVILLGIPVKVVAKEYNLSEEQIRKVINKDSTVTEEEYLNWFKK